MFFRDQTIDVSVLYSLRKDLERFWQYKTFRWEPLLKRQATFQELRGHSLEEKSQDPNEAGIALLEAQEDYILLRRRILDERQHALEVVDFIGVNAPKHLLNMDFISSLPESCEIESAIEEVSELAHYASHLHYPVQTLRHLLGAIWEWIKGLMRPQREE